MENSIVELKSVTKRYKKLYALKDCSISIEMGRIYGVVGPNGAGKTTLLRLILGLSAPTGGEILYKGDKKLQDASISFGAIIEKPYINHEMTAYQNLRYIEILGGNNDKNHINKILDMVGLGNVGKKKVKNYSLGMKQRLGLAMAVINNPDILVLDEPMNGLDPDGIIDFRKHILDLYAEKNCTIIISSHILSELNKIATDYIFIKDGVILCELDRCEIEKFMKEKHFSDIEELYMDIIRGQDVWTI